MDGSTALHLDNDEHFGKRDIYTKLFIYLIVLYKSKWIVIRLRKLMRLLTFNNISICGRN